MALTRIEEVGEKIASQDFVKGLPYVVERVRSVWRFIRNPQMAVLKVKISDVQKSMAETGNKLVARLTTDLMAVDVSKMPALKSIWDKTINIISTQVNEYTRNPVEYFW